MPRKGSCKLIRRLLHDCLCFLCHVSLYQAKKEGKRIYVGDGHDDDADDNDDDGDDDDDDGDDGDDDYNNDGDDDDG